MKKVFDALKRELWVILLDILAVNASYYLALLIRFYVNFQLRPVAVDRYLPAWVGFTPWYTLIALCIFGAFRLYGGMWRYAGINDMNRIILANLATTIVHILGTAFIFTRMPITYYVIGGILQFLMVAATRFGYRVLLVERKRMNSRRLSHINCVVIGAGENGRRVVKHLEESDVYRPVAILSQSNKTGMMDGVPVKPISDLDLSGIGAVFIANPLLESSMREEIKAKADAAGIEFLDYTGFFSNLGGRLSLTELLSTIHGPLTISLEGKETTYNDGSQALQSLTEKHTVKSIEANSLKITIAPAERVDREEALRAAYAAVTGP